MSARLGYLMQHLQPMPYSLVRWLLAALIMAVAVPAMAQFKVVQPDGSVTYTDRPPSSGNARVTPLGRLGNSSEPDAGLPPDLRQAMQRYPVVLYTTADCQPCDTGRKLLQQRGVPYSERRIVSEEEALALERVAGGRTVPALTIGAQPVRGYSETEWLAYLDAAGYPRESKLPRNWQTPEPAAAVDRAVPVRPAPTAAQRAPEPPPAQGGVRF
jgi:glutaredoxin